MLKKIGFFGIIQIICAVIAAVLSFMVLRANHMLTFAKWLRWEIFWYVILALFTTVIFAHKYAQGKVQEVIFFLSTAISVSNLMAFPLFCLIKSKFNYTKITHTF